MPVRCDGRKFDALKFIKYYMCKTRLQLMQNLDFIKIGRSKNNQDLYEYE